MEILKQSLEISYYNNGANFILRTEYKPFEDDIVISREMKWHYVGGGF